MSKGVGVHDLKRLLDAFNKHDLDAIMEFFTEDSVFDMPHGPDPYGRRYIGKAAVREGLATRFEGLPDVHYGEDSHWVAGDRGCSEWTLTGTRSMGEKVKVRGCDLFQFKDGKISKKDSFWKVVQQ